MAYRPNWYQDTFRFRLWRRALPWILAVTIGAYVLELVLVAATDGEALVVLGLVPSLAVGQGWLWQFFTSPLLHDPFSFYHILFNLLFLYWLGTDVELLYGTRRFLLLYVGGALAAGMVHCAGAYLWGDLGIPVVGASGAIMAVAVLAAIHFPDQTFLLFFALPIKLKWLVLLYIVWDLHSVFRGEPTGVANLAHLGGAAYGGCFWLVSTGRWLRGWKIVQPRRPRRQRAAEQEELPDDVDRILDKISREGIGSLDDRERKILDNASRKQRKPGGAL